MDLRLTLALALVIVPFGGCISEGPSKLQGFEAEIDVDGALHKLTLSGPEEILNRDLRTFRAYVLTDEVAGAPPRTYWLDSTFHVVRQGFPCDTSGGNCERQETLYWERQGRLAPYGIGLLHALEGKTLTSWSDWDLASVAVDLEQANGKTNIKLPASRPTDLPEVALRDLQFEGRRLLPDSSRWDVLAWNEGPAMLPADRLDSEVPDPIVRAGGGLYADAGRDVFARGIVDNAFLDALRSHSGAANVLSDGCVVLFNTPLEPRLEMTGTIPLLMQEVQVFRGVFLLVGNTNKTIWDAAVEIRKQDGQPNRADVVSFKSSGTAPSLDCSGIAEASRSTNGMEAAFAVATRVAPVGTFDSYNLQQNRLVLSLRPASKGWDRAGFFYEPAWVDVQGLTAYDPYFVQVDLGRLWLERIVHDPSAGRIQ